MFSPDEVREVEELVLRETKRLAETAGSAHDFSMQIEKVNQLINVLYAMRS